MRFFFTQKKVTKPGYLRMGDNQQIYLREDVPFDMPDAIFGGDMLGNTFVRDNVPGGSVSVLARADESGDVALDAPQ